LEEPIFLEGQLDQTTQLILLMEHKLLAIYYFPVVTLDGPDIQVNMRFTQGLWTYGLLGTAHAESVVECVVVGTAPENRRLH
jgi:hypothetical protein